MAKETKEDKELKAIKKKIKKMNPVEMASWLKDTHDEYIEQVSQVYFAGGDFLSGTDVVSRLHITTYATKIVYLLNSLDIDGFDSEVGDILFKDCYTDLFLILNVLNYL